MVTAEARADRKITTLPDVDIPVPGGNYTNIFRTLGNSEMHCVALLFMPDTPSSRTTLGQIREDIEGVYSGEHPIIAGNLHSYIKVLRFAGLVQGDTSDGFTITPYGVKFRPIAKFLLQSSADLPFPLQSYFSNKSKLKGEDTNAAIARSEALDYLAGQTEEVDATSTSESMGMNKTTTARILRNLEATGLSTSRKEDRRKLYKISESGKHISTNIIKPIKLASDGDRALLNEWNKINWLDYVDFTVRRYYETSGNVIKRARGENETKEVESFIVGHPEGVAPGEVDKFLGKPTIRIRHVLLREGVMESIGKGSATRIIPRRTSLIA